MRRVLGWRSRPAEASSSCPRSCNILSIASDIRLLKPAKRAYNSLVSGVTASAAAVGVAARKSAAKSASVGRVVKIKYAHQGGKNPPTVVLHGNMLKQLPASYLRYIASAFGKAFGLVGTRVRLELRTSKNPYSAGRRTTRRQNSPRMRGHAR